MTPALFAQALLSRLGLPNTDDNVRALVAFQAQEGGHENGALYNPLNTKRGTSTGDKDLPSVNFKTKKPGAGIQSFQSWDDGLEATARTMAQTNMRPIMNVLSSKATAENIVHVIGDSDWGWWDPKKGKAFKLPHLGADAVVKSDAVFRKQASRIYSGASDFLKGMPSGGLVAKYFAFAVGAVGLVLLGARLFRKRSRR
jgi:hypothetical protein